MSNKCFDRVYIFVFVYYITKYIIIIITIIIIIIITILKWNQKLHDNIYESVWLQYDGKISLIVSSPPSSLEYCLTKLPIIRVHMYGVNNTENCTVIVKCHSSFYASTKKKKTSKCHERYLFTVKLKSSSTRACFRKKFYFTFHSLSFARFHFCNIFKKKKKKKRFYSHLKNSIFFSLLFFIDDFVDILYHDE